MAAALFLLGRQRIEAAFVEAHRGFNIFDMHVQALLNRFELATQQITAGQKVEALAFEFLDGQVNPIAVRSKTLNHGRCLFGCILHDGFHLLEFWLNNLESCLGSCGHLFLNCCAWLFQAPALQQLGET
jgi:hypothetical protein